MMERRVLLAIALAVLVLFAFRYVEERRAPQSGRLRPPATQKSAPPASPAEAVAPPPAAAAAAGESSLPGGDTNAAPAVINIDAPSYHAVLDNRGAVITSWVLKNFKSAAGEPFDMIPSGDNSRPFPGTVLFSDPNSTNRANQDAYQIELADGASRNLMAPATVVMRLRQGDLSIEKRFTFSKDNYVVEFSGVFLKDGKPEPARILVGEDIGPAKEHLMIPSLQLSAVADVAGKIQRESPPKDPSQVLKFDGTVDWAGLEMQYFAMIAVPRQPFAGYDIQKKPIQVVGLGGDQVSRDLLRVAVHSSGNTQFSLYVGPKKASDLESVNGVNLTAVINYGTFSLLVRPLLAGLKYIDRFVHNYGVAIILLTLALTLALFPFRLKQMLSMKKMSVVQPKIKSIQEKYRRYKKTDPKRAEMNQEIMAVYKEHGVNPLGGCLPLLLQLPFLYAFYSLLASSIELRHAPFVFWIHDLSSKDPYYILPIIMGVTMLISQKMTPMAPGTDPTQAKMMTVLPAVFTLMFLNVSSGLNLYFLCSNIFQVALQKLSERWIGDGRSRVKSQA